MTDAPFYRAFPRGTVELHSSRFRYKCQHLISSYRRIEGDHGTLKDKSEATFLRLDFDRRLKLEFNDFNVTPDAGLLPFDELSHAFGLTEIPFETTETLGILHSLPMAFQEPYCLLSSTLLQSSSGECQSRCSRTDIVDFAG